MEVYTIMLQYHPWFISYIQLSLLLEHGETTFDTVRWWYLANTQELSTPSLGSCREVCKDIGEGT
jgi:hypothetical protein